MSAQSEETKLKLKKAKRMTILFNKIKTKLGLLEPLTPTWHWARTIRLSPVFGLLAFRLGAFGCILGHWPLF